MVIVLRSAMLQAVGGAHAIRNGKSEAVESVCRESHEHAARVLLLGLFCLVLAVSSVPSRGGEIAYGRTSCWRYSDSHSSGRGNQGAPHGSWSAGSLCGAYPLSRRGPS